jgi:uncharacterized membrane protein YgcG
MRRSLISAWLALAVSLGVLTPLVDAATTRQAVFDGASLLAPARAAKIESEIQAMRLGSGLDLVVVTAVLKAPSADAAAADAAAAIGAHAVGVGYDGGVIIMIEVDSSQCHGQVNLSADGAGDSRLPADVRQVIYDRYLLPQIKTCDFATGLDQTIAAMMAALGGPPASPGSTASGSSGVVPEPGASPVAGDRPTAPFFAGLLVLALVGMLSAFGIIWLGIRSLPSDDLGSVTPVAPLAPGVTMIDHDLEASDTSSDISTDGKA